MKRTRNAICLIFFCIITSFVASQETGKELSILFVGNSQIYTNRLPDMFKDIAMANGKKVNVAESTAPKYRIIDHLRKDWTLNIAKSKPWDIVIFNDQYQNLMDYDNYDNALFPSIRQFADLFPQTTKVCMFTNLALEDGFDNGNGNNGFESMQKELIALSDTISEKCKVKIIPLGDAGMEVHRQIPQLDLWKADRSHPTIIGSYIMASVFYAYVFDEMLTIEHYRPEHEAEATVNLINQIAFEIVQAKKQSE